MIYHQLTKLRGTFLLDEFDNLELAAKAVMRAVLNAGHRRGGSVSRMMQGAPMKYTVFAPVALAGIGSLPLPLMSRSIVIRMRRHDGSRPLHRFDVAKPEAVETVETIEKLDVVYRHIVHWSRRVALERDPAMPAELRGRRADNWRPLIAIADACSPAWSHDARRAATIFAGSDHDEDVGVVLLRHARAIFDMRNAERLASKVLVADLIEHDDLWSEYRGPQGDEQPRKLTQGALADLLRPFGIRSKKCGHQGTRIKPIAVISVLTSKRRGVPMSTPPERRNKAVLSGAYGASSGQGRGQTAVTIANWTSRIDVAVAAVMAIGTMNASAIPSVRAGGANSVMRGYSTAIAVEIASIEPPPSTSITSPPDALLGFPRTAETGRGEFAQ